jgi:NADH-quinone oxidoreductase subunit C
MSSEENKPLPPKAEVAQAAAPVKPEPAEPAPIEPGPLGQQLITAGVAITPLGFDAYGVELMAAEQQTALDAAQWLKRHGLFDLVVSVTGVDLKTSRESVYHLYSTTTYGSAVLKVRSDAEDRSPSLFPVWPAVDWHEREAYDLMGICYEGHPDLRRILMPDDWLGHPLRKDYKENDPRLVWNAR